MDRHLKNISDDVRLRLERLEDKPEGIMMILNSLLILNEALRAKIIVLEAMHMPNGH